MAAGLGEPWCRDGSMPEGCPLSMVFIVALYVPWCRRLESMPSIRRQLYADNLKCSSVCPRASFGAARLKGQYVRSVGQDVSRGTCVLLSTYEAVRKTMEMASLGRRSLTCGISAGILTSLDGLGRGLFLVGLGSHAWCGCFRCPFQGFQVKLA